MRTFLCKGVLLRYVMREKYCVCAKKAVPLQRF